MANKILSQRSEEYKTIGKKGYFYKFLRIISIVYIRNFFNWSSFVIKKNDIYIYIAIYRKYLFQIFSLFWFTIRVVITFQENRCNVPLVTKTESNSKLCFRSGTRGGGGGGRGLYTVSGNFTRAAVDIFMQMRLPFFFLSLPTRVVNNAGRTRFRRNRASKLRWLTAQKNLDFKSSGGTMGGKEREDDSKTNMENNNKTINLHSKVFSLPRCIFWNF